ncbi:MAG: alpha/beta hydrolase [Chloroflexi bacterium]|nr:alpha/beta hydrolase [Chloroflexota bacterium]
MKAFVPSRDGIRICYEVSGQGSPCFVFVHGWCCDKSYWDDQVAYFSRTNKVVTLDLAGHGESDLGRGDFTMGSFGEDVAAVARHLGEETVVLIGHSMGGPVIVEAAQRIPGRIVGVIGVDTFRNLEQDLTAAEVEEQLAPMRANFVEACQTLVQSMFLPSSDPMLRKRIVADMSSAPALVGISAMHYLRSQRADLRRGLLAVTAPKTAINSDYRPNDVPVAQRYSLEVTVMPGVGHFVMIEDPKTFNRLLEGTIRKVMRQAPE